MIELLLPHFFHLTRSMRIMTTLVPRWKSTNLYWRAAKKRAMSQAMTASPTRRRPTKAPLDREKAEMMMITDEEREWENSISREPLCYSYPLLIGKR